jgi:Cysteine rich repeat
LPRFTVRTEATIEEKEIRMVRVMVAGMIAALFTAAEAQQGACKADVEKLCPGIQPGEGRILECLKSHKAEVSPGCTKHLKEVQAELKKVSAACEPDMEKFCWETPMGKGGIASCLKKHSDELSPDCKSAITKAKASHTKH